MLLLGATALMVRHRRLQRERRELEMLNDALREAKAQADSASQGKSRFLANMSHELRTPFNGLLGMLDMLEETQLTRQQRDHLLTARDSARHLLNLLNVQAHYSIPGELVEAAVQQGRGLLLLTPHLGCFEAIAQGWALRAEARTRIARPHA